MVHAHAHAVMHMYKQLVRHEHDCHDCVLCTFRVCLRDCSFHDLFACVLFWVQILATFETRAPRARALVPSELCAVRVQLYQPDWLCVQYPFGV